jgi:hypothetical protein
MAPTIARPPTTKPRASLVVAACALAVGAFAYLVRGADLVASDWTGISLRAARSFFAPLRDVVPAPILGVLPDIAWAAALALVLARLRASRGFVLAGFVLCAGWEIGQALRVFPGTFDPADLVTSCLAYTAVVFAHRFSLRKGFAS